MSAGRSLAAVKANSSKFRRLGRWSEPSQESASLITYWSGASVSFHFFGTFLGLQTGPRTERKDRFNGGTPMIACSISVSSQGSGEERTTTHECGPSQEVTLIDGIPQELPVKVTITLIDWASVFELQSIMVDSVSRSLILLYSSVTPHQEDSILPLPEPVPPPDRVLGIGDSITAGYSDGSQPIPFGCLTAFLHVARNRLKDNTGADVELELIAYPGITLASPTPEEVREGAGSGMVDRFFHVRLPPN